MLKGRETVEVKVESWKREDRYKRREHKERSESTRRLVLHWEPVLKLGGPINTELVSCPE